MPLLSAVLAIIVLPGMQAAKKQKPAEVSKTPPELALRAYIDCVRAPGKQRKLGRLDRSGLQTGA